MADFVTLTCPTCGGKLLITSDVERFACGYCGNELVIDRRRGIVSASPFVEKRSKMQAGVDMTASELAIVRLEREIAQIAARVNRLQQSSYGLSFCVLGAIALFAWAFIGLLGQVWSAVVIFGITGTILLDSAKMLYEARAKNPDLVRNRLLLSHKRNELARHREIVRQEQQKRKPA